jgi:anti-sigma factor RsiW
MEQLLSADELDPGCDAAIPVLDQYVDVELDGRDPVEQFPLVAAHLRGCSACAADHDGLLEAATRFSDA